MKLSDEVRQILHKLYSEPSRKYHNLNHIQDCLNELQDFNASATSLSESQINEVALALWFHDAIYNAKSSENEARSAELWVSLSEKMSEIDPSRRERVRSMIMATKDHVARDAMEELVVDIDLSILGRDEVAFDKYDGAIRSEYSWVPEQVYREKRAEVLKSFLRRDRLFRTDHLYRKYERSARKNLARAIQRLEEASQENFLH